MPWQTSVPEPCQSQQMSLDQTLRWLLDLVNQHGLPKPRVDFIATRHITHLNNFVSPVLDPHAVEINALPQLEF